MKESIEGVELIENVNVTAPFFLPIITTTKQNTGEKIMHIEAGKTIRAKGDWDEELEKMKNTILREGSILERLDKETDKGLKTGFFVEWDGAEYLIRMLRGQTLSVRKLWEIEK